MSPVHFKLTKDGHTRRISFAHSPTWSELAAKLQALYGISVDNVGVSYIDTDNDEITASSDEELQEYFQSCYQPGSSIKFNVLDLSIPRGSPNALNAQSSRNTFGQENYEFVHSPNWKGLASFPLGEFLDSSTPSEGPHAFVEIVNSDVSGFGKDNDDISDIDSVDQASTVQRISYADKGKQRSMSFGAASNISLLGEEQSQKFPIHVYDHNSKLKSSTSNSQGSDHGNIADTAEGVQVDKFDSPKVTTDDIKEPKGPAVVTEPAEPAVEETTVSAQTEDPPLPSIDSAPTSNVSAALSHDVATLLTTVSNVISTHPELSESVHNIVTNARSGAYWRNHRTALTEAVNDLTRSDDIRHIEEEATRRVNDALGTLFRSLSIGPDSTGVDQNQSNTPDSMGPLSSHPIPGWSRRRWNRRSATGFGAYRPSSVHIDHPPWPYEHLPFYTPSNIPVFYGPPTHGPPRAQSNAPPPPPPPHMNSTARAGPPPPPPPPAEQIQRDTTPGPIAPPPPPPPPGSPSKGGPPHGNHPHFGHPLPPVPPPPPPHVGFPPFMHGPPRPVFPLPHPPQGFPPFVGPSSFFPPPPSVLPQVLNNPPPVVTAQPSAPSAVPRTYNNPFSDPAEEQAEKPTEQQLRDQVEEAKRLYKENKEVYRKYREERKKEKESRRNADEAGKSNPVPQDKTREEVSQVVSQGRDGYPKLEMYSVRLPGPGPRRYNTHLGHGASSRGIERKGDDLNTRAQIRIARRLADMGFSENTYPDLPDKIKAQVPTDKVMSKEAEDDAVTTLLEEMLARSTRSPGASKGGAWH